VHRKTSTTYDVEILTNEGLWARHGASAPAERAVKSKRFNIAWRRWGLNGLGALISVGLHVLLVGGVIIGASGRPTVKPPIEGAAPSSQNDNATEFVSAMLLFNDRSITPPDQSANDSAYAVQKEEKLVADKAVLLSAVDTPPVPQVEGGDVSGDEDSPTVEATGDDAGRAMLFGRYMGQIKARIERAWDQPESSVRQFDCTVQIKQSARGEVQEITLQRCDTEAAWQMSLVQAIQRASPLSAPPNEGVFSDVITLSFAGRVSAPK